MFLFLLRTVNPVWWVPISNFKQDEKFLYDSFWLHWIYFIDNIIWIRCLLVLTYVPSQFHEILRLCFYPHLHIPNITQFIGTLYLNSPRSLPFSRKSNFTSRLLKTFFSSFFLSNPSFSYSTIKSRLCESVVNFSRGSVLTGHFFKT